MDAMEKGRTAERIVANLFKEAGFKVYKYGYEYTLPKLADRTNPIKGRAAEYIRHQPDFIVVNGGNEAFFVEVKFRSSQIVPDKEIFPYPNCYVVLLTKDYILAQSTRYLFDKGAHFAPIVMMPPFSNIPRTILMKYVSKVRRELGDETISGQVLGKLVSKFTNLKLHRKPASKFRTVTSNGKEDSRHRKGWKSTRWNKKRVYKRRV